MSKIEQVKVYNGSELETVFFRPIMNKAKSMKALLNVSSPPRICWWKRDGMPKKYTKQVELSKVNIEISHPADDYFDMVYQIMRDSGASVDDLSAQELENAKCFLLRGEIIDHINDATWCGSNYMDGIIDKMMSDDEIPSFSYSGDDSVEDLFRRVWEQASTLLQGMKLDGKLRFYVSPDIYKKYDGLLHYDEYNYNPAIVLYYKGIYIEKKPSNSQSFIMLTDERNLALAVDTTGRESEARLWYNPDTIENKQRVVFEMGVDYLLPELISLGVGENKN